MNAFFTSLTALTSGLLKVSLQASLVVALLLLVQWLGRKHLSPRVRYALWLLVVARLLLPVSLESKVSLFNFTRATPANVFQAGGAASNVSAAKVETNRAPAPASPATSASAPTADAAAASAKLPAAKTTPSASALPPVASSTFSLTASSPRQPFPWGPVLSTLWLAGVIFLLARIIWIPLRLNARLAQHETATPSTVFEALEESKRLSGVNQVLPIVQSRAVESPALLGFIRPWLLLPEGLVEKFTPQELRLVFLHELAHLKRRDIAVNWLATLLQILHWPNPLVWLAFARMRADRELACDELALSFARAGESQTYGHAMIKLLEGFRRPAVLPGLVGILEDQQHMKRRIAMIAQFKKMTQWSAAAVAVVLILGLVTLTDAQTEKTPPPAKYFGADGPRVRTLLSGTSADVFGVLAPDESAVVYIDWGDKGANLMLRDLSTGTTKVLVRASGKEDSYDFPEAPVWAPDSKSIAYQWEGGGDKISLRVIPRGGGVPRVVREGREESEGVFTWCTPLDWSKDGKLLLVKEAYSYRSTKAPTLAILDVATGAIHRIGPDGAHARLSPDGRFAVCERIAAGNRDIFLVKVDGAEMTRVTTSPAADGCPIFSSDGKFILFTSNRRGSWDLWAVKFEGGRTSGVEFPVRYDFGDHTKWNTASGKIAFSIASSGVDGRPSTDIYFVAGTRDAVEARARPEPVAKGYAGRNFAGDWSPDGKYVAYGRWRGPSIDHPALCVLSVVDGVERVYEPGMKRIGRLFWSPDSQIIGMSGAGDERSGGNGTYLFSPLSGKRISDRLKRQSSDLGFSGHRFSQDGKEIVVPGPKKSFAVNIETGVEREMSGYESTTLPYTVVREDGNQRLVLTVRPGDKRVLASLREPGLIRSYPISPDRTRFGYSIFWGEKHEPKEELHLAAVDGSWDRIINTSGMFSGREGARLRWSPDGSKLVATLREEASGEIGVLENFAIVEKVAQR